jgi:hypothetical protein
VERNINPANTALPAILERNAFRREAYFREIISLMEVCGFCYLFFIDTRLEERMNNLPIVSSGKICGN